MNITTVFTHSIDTEVERVLQSSINIGNGFYQFHGFAVLPRQIRGNHSCIYFPKLPIDLIPNYWNYMRVQTDDFPVAVSSEFYEAAKSLFSGHLELLPPEQLSLYQSNWHTVQEGFWESVHMLFPSIFPLITQLEIRLTRYGSGASFSLPKESTNNAQQLIIYVRDDMPTSAIAEGILSAFTQAIAPRLDLVWEHTEAISDFLLDSLMLNKVLPEAKTTLSSLKRLPHDLVDESQHYLLSLQIPPLYHLREQRGHIYLGTDSIDAKISPNQKRLLDLLIQNMNQVVTFDHVAETLESKEFSLWAIHKHVQRLRDQLTKVGYPGYRIQSVRGIGYSLVE